MGPFCENLVFDNGRKTSLVLIARDQML
jgi:hypothetical protein